MSAAVVKATEVMNVTCCTEEQAKQCLNAARNNVAGAIEYYYSNPRLFPKKSEGNVNKLNKLFEAKYAGEGEDTNVCCDDKLSALFKDAQIGDQIKRYAILHKLNAKTLGELSKEEFVKGFSALGASDVKEIVAVCKTIGGDVADWKGRKFRDMYRWIFVYAKDENARSLDAETACAHWNAVLPTFFKLHREFIQYVKENVKFVNQDAWSCVYDYAINLKDDLSNVVDENGAWNSLLDEFGAWYLKQNKQ